MNLDQQYYHMILSEQQEQEELELWNEQNSLETI